MQQPTIFFAHGKESGPWGSKIRALASVAREKGFRVESPDYFESFDPETRIRKRLYLADLSLTTSACGWTKPFVEFVDYNGVKGYGDRSGSGTGVQRSEAEQSLGQWQIEGTDVYCQGAERPDEQKLIGQKTLFENGDVLAAAVENSGQVAEAGASRWPGP